MSTIEPQAVFTLSELNEVIRVRVREAANEARLQGRREVTDELTPVLSAAQKVLDARDRVDVVHRMREALEELETAIQSAGEPVWVAARHDNRAVADVMDTVRATVDEACEKAAMNGAMNVLVKVEGALTTQMGVRQWDPEWVGLSEALRLVRQIRGVE